jgi:hypothetical protein
MKVSVNYVIFAESVIRDESKKISLINLFNKIQAERFPSAQNKLVVLFNFEKEPGASKRPLYFFAYTPDGERFAKAEIDIVEGPEGARETQIVVDLSGMPLPIRGEYLFEVGYSEKDIIIGRPLSVDPLDEIKRKKK